MTSLLKRNLLILLVITTLMVPGISQADSNKKGKGHGGNHQGLHKQKNKLIIIAPRKRVFKGKTIIRIHGHSYHGYGHHLHDDDAWKWLAFTVITLKVLDNLNEQAQREHEAAQIAATTAPVGKRIVWETESASGYVVSTREGVDAVSGLTCREFQHKITVGGQTEDAYGTACLQEDGSWQMVQ